jgi:7-cyano-7-deazaguanine synthase in queuosine biosynthesis
VAAAALTTSRVTIEQAKNMPRNYPEMPNDVLLTMAIMGDQDAREERMIREIMSVDNVSW